MNTQIRNSDFQKEIEASLKEKLPRSPLPFAFALVDGIQDEGDDFIKSDRGKALLHLLNTFSHGKAYYLDGYKEHHRLIAVFRE